MGTWTFEWRREWRWSWRWNWRWRRFSTTGLTLSYTFQNLNLCFVTLTCNVKVSLFWKRLVCTLTLFLNFFWFIIYIRHIFLFFNPVVCFALNWNVFSYETIPKFKFDFTYKSNSLENIGIFLNELSAMAKAMITSMYLFTKKSYINNLYDF